MKIIIDGKEYKPKDNKINKDDIVVDVHYDRKQGMYAICLRDKNTRYVLSDYEYAKDKKEAQFVKAMMLDDLRNYLDRDYELVEALQQDEKVKDKNGRDFRIWTEHTGYQSGQDEYIKIAYLGDNWIGNDDKVIKENILGYLEYVVYDDKCYVSMIEIKGSEKRKGIATALIKSLQNEYKDIDYGYTTEEGTELLHALGIRESVDSELTFKFPNLQQAIDFFWSDRDVNIERVPIEQLVKDNDLLNDEDLQSYHQTQWGNKPASEFSIDRNKVNSMRTSEVPYAVRKKDGRLELGDGRHRTRALYNDGYKYVELPVINETLDLSGEISATINSLKKNDKLITPKEINGNKVNLQEDKSSSIRVGDEITDKQAKTFYDRGYIDILVKNDKGESKLIPAWHSNETQKELSRELVKDKKTGKDSLKITGNKVDLPKFEQVVSDIKKELGNNIKFYTQSPESNKTYPNEIETDVQDRVTGKAYKLFKVVNGKLYPPIVKNTGAKETPTNVWIKCGSPEFVEVSSSWGKPQVSQTAKGNLSFRAGWHLGELPYAPQFESKKNPGYLSSDKFVWAECDYDATINYQDRAMSYGFTKDGKFTNSAAGLPYRPIGGYYKYRTNPNPNTIAWVITGSMRVNKVLEDSEVEKICKENGVPYLKRPGGDKTLKELGLKESLSEDLNTQEQKQLGEIDELIDDLYKLRQESIQQDGEFGVGNLVFKEMRNMGYLDNLKNLKRKLQSKEMSLGEALLLEKGTDYKKQAVKIISNSGLFDEETSTKIIEGLFRQDIHAFNHAPAWLEKYLKGIARMMVEYCGGDSGKAQQFLLDNVSVFEYYLNWVKANREKVGNQLDDEFINKLSIEELNDKVNKMQEEQDKKSQDELSQMEFGDSNYTLVPIDSYEQMHKLYGGHWTGDGTDEEGEYAGHGGTSWCHTNSEGTYKQWVNSGNYKFFVLQRNDWKSIPFDEYSNDEKDGKDDYGNSLIALLISNTGKLKNATLRCNHVGVSGSADNQYETYAELSKLAGFNVQEEIAKNVKFTSNIEHYGNSVRMDLGRIEYAHAENNPKYIIDCYRDGYLTDFMSQLTFSEIGDDCDYKISNNVKEKLYNLHIENNLRTYGDLIKLTKNNQDEELDDLMYDIQQLLTYAVEDGEAVGTLNSTHRELMDYITHLIYAKNIVSDGDGYYIINYDEDGLEKLIDDVDTNAYLDDCGDDVSDYSLEELIEWKLNDDRFNRYFDYSDFDFDAFEDSFNSQLSELEDELERKKQDYLKKTYGGKTLFDYNDNEQ